MNASYAKMEITIVGNARRKLKFYVGDTVGYVNEHTHDPVVGSPEALKVLT